MPKLSIITPVYNAVDFLEETVKSILAQTFTDFELILVDDGSTDGSGDLCDRLAAQDSRIRVFHKENGGVASARNMGLDAVRGEYIGWVDSDDLVSPVMFQILMDAAEKYGADIVQCEHKREMHMLTLEMPDPMPEPVITDGVGSLKRIHGPRNANYMALWSKIYRAELWSGIRFTPGRAFEDDECTPKLLYRGKVNAFYDLPLYRYTYREGSIVMHAKAEDVIALTTHLENRMHWFKELDDQLYADGRYFFFCQLKNRLCQEAFKGTAVQDYAAKMLIKHTKTFWPIAHRYDRITLLLLRLGKGAVRWIGRNDFAPIQNFLAKIKRLLRK